MIVSKQNQTIKYIKKLSQKKYREENLEYVAEGVKEVREAFLSGASVKTVVGTIDAINQLGVELKSVSVVEVDENVFSYISTEVSPQGVLAVIGMPDVTPKKANGCAVLLDRVRDPGNLGTILRTVVAANVKDVYLVDCVDPFSPKTVRASMGGVFRANIYQGTPDEILENVTAPIVVADMDGENVFDTAYCEDFCLVIGNEANGVSAELKARAKKTFSIPMENGIESLNAGVSAGILVYTLMNKRR